MEEKFLQDKKARDLAEKIEFICKTQGEMISKSPLEVYGYASFIDDIELYLINGQGSQGTFKEISARDSESPALLDYFVSSSPEKGGRVDYFQEGPWEEVVEVHYRMALGN